MLGMPNDWSDEHRYNNLDTVTRLIITEVKSYDRAVNRNNSATDCPLWLKIDVLMFPMVV